MAHFSFKEKTMLTVDDNQNISITRGDTLTLLVEPYKDGELYIPQEGDTLRFAVSIGYVGRKGYKLIETIDIPTDTMTFTMTSEQTQDLIFSQYNYDVELTYADGTVDTFISAKLNVLKEVE